MGEKKGNIRSWKFLYWLTGFVRRKFNFTPEIRTVPETCLIISNHVTNWDPLLLTQSFPNTPIAFVASEHIFRLGIISWLIEKLVHPIPRKKATTGADTVMTCMRRIRAGDSVCIFAEGDTTWNGITQSVFPATGKLARSCGASLVTYRIEGGYLSFPRWAKRQRKGRSFGRIVGIYSPEELKAMKPDEISALINRDIFEDTWERQRAEHIKFSGKGLAEGIERGYYVCPACERIGSIRGKGDEIGCSCGFKVLYTDEGFLSPAKPFETLAQWDAWQSDAVARISSQAEELMFSDEGIALTEIGSAHAETALGSGRLEQYPDKIVCAGRSFSLDGINSMAMVKSTVLLFSHEESYYELRAVSDCSLRKYLTVWSSRK